MKRIAWVLLLGCLGCGGSTPGAGDAGLCALGDGGVVVRGEDVCDGIDNDCNGLVDDGPTIESYSWLYADRDGDGFGDPYSVLRHSCLLPGYIEQRADGIFDCDDANPTAPPGPSPVCDYDHDGFLGGSDCDDQDAERNPYAIEICNGIDDDCDGLVDDADQAGRFDESHRYVLDVDHDGFPSDIQFRCAGPDAGYEPYPSNFVSVGDCAPLDPAIHPGQLDDCATQTDRNCDGRYSPVFVASGQSVDGLTRPEVEALFTAAGPTDPPTRIVFTSYVVIDLCPGTYRVSLGATDDGPPVWYATLHLRGHGATPTDVILDGADVASPIDFPYGPSLIGQAQVLLENLTLAHGSSGGIHIGEMWSPWIDCNAVAFQHGTAPRGSAMDLSTAWAPSVVRLTDTTFDDLHATVAGGAIAASAIQLTMSGGGFTNVTAPLGTGSAISAALVDGTVLDLQGVDLSGITDDIVLTTSGAPILRDLGANATLHCDFATGCTP